MTIKSDKATEANKVKKGKRTWKQATPLTVVKKDPKFRYRWVSKEAGNMSKKQIEGWEFVNPETGIPGEHDHPERIQDGKPDSTVKEYRDMVLMALPEDLAESRDEYFEQRTRQQERGLKDTAQRQANAASGGTMGSAIETIKYDGIE